MAQKLSKIDLQTQRKLQSNETFNNIALYDTLLFFHMECVRSIGHRSDTLTTHILIDQKNLSNYKTVL